MRVREHLANRSVLAFRAETIRTALAKEFDFKLEEINAALAFLVKNWVRPRGLFQLGLPCLLTGTGMAFPWSVIARVQTSSPVEQAALQTSMAPRERSCGRISRRRKSKWSGSRRKEV